MSSKLSNYIPSSISRQLLVKISKKMVKDKISKGQRKKLIMSKRFKIVGFKNSCQKLVIVYLIINVHGMAQN